MGDRDLFGDPVGPSPEELLQQQRLALSGRLVGGWIKRQPIRPSPKEIAKQGKIAKRICEANDPEAVIAAALGIEQLFPYSKGEPWDLFDLERKFSKAVAAAPKHPDLQPEHTGGGIAAIMHRRRNGDQ